MTPLPGSLAAELKFFGLHAQRVQLMATLCSVPVGSADFKALRIELARLDQSIADAKVSDELVLQKFTSTTKP